MLYKTLGILRHSRNLPGQDHWWLVVDCDIEIIRYYRWLSERELGRKINTPKHGAHVTVINGTEPLKNKEQWGKFNGEKVELEVGKIYTLPPVEKQLFCLEIKCPKLVEARQFFGLESEFPFHMTIGWFK